MCLLPIRLERKWYTPPTSSKTRSHGRLKRTVFRHAVVQGSTKTIYCQLPTPLKKPACAPIHLKKPLISIRKSVFGATASMKAPRHNTVNKLPWLLEQTNTHCGYATTPRHGQESLCTLSSFFRPATTHSRRTAKVDRDNRHHYGYNAKADKFYAQ